MRDNHNKYPRFNGIDLKDRQWPNKRIENAPIWCSVDLRDGNQALENPMNLEQKLRFFAMLTGVGFKEIEVGFPSASDTEFETIRALIEKDLIPDDVTIQVLVQAREHLIERTFEAIKGAKNVILHFYNSVSKLQRKVVFDTDVDGVTKIATDAAKLIKKLSEKAMQEENINIRYEYSPESFSGTEMDVAVEICDKVLEELGASKENKAIINLPSTVEMSTPNTYADQVEYFINNLKHRDSALISIHPHNDRGTGVAATELGLMAGADRVEGTLFGNGERTGNADIMNVALNLYSQGIDPELDFSHLNHIKKIYEDSTGLKIHERHPYAGELVFTAFSGSHQDAINKGTQYLKEHDSDFWEVPYLPIDPADIGREYEPIIRINSQSGKGGAAFVMQHDFGYVLPRKMHAEFGAYIKAECDKLGREISSQEVFDLFYREYIDIHGPYHLRKWKIFEENIDDENVVATFEGFIKYHDEMQPISGTGNGPIDAFFSALNSIHFEGFEFASYSEHGISSGADSKAVSYIELKHNDKSVYGVGIDNNISIASIKGILCAINRTIQHEQAEEK